MKKTLWKRILPFLMAFVMLFTACLPAGALTISSPSDEDPYYSIVLEGGVLHFKLNAEKVYDMLKDGEVTKDELSKFVPEDVYALLQKGSGITVDDLTALVLDNVSAEDIDELKALLPSDLINKYFNLEMLDGIISVDELLSTIDVDALLDGVDISGLINKDALELMLTEDVKQNILTDAFIQSLLENNSDLIDEILNAKDEHGNYIYRDDLAALVDQGVIDELLSKENDPDGAKLAALTAYVRNSGMLHSVLMDDEAYAGLKAYLDGHDLNALLADTEAMDALYDLESLKNFIEEDIGASKVLEGKTVNWSYFASKYGITADNFQTETGLTDEQMQDIYADIQFNWGGDAEKYILEYYIPNNVDEICEAYDVTVESLVKYGFVTVDEIKALIVEEWHNILVDRDLTVEVVETIGLQHLIDDFGYDGIVNAIGGYYTMIQKSWIDEARVIEIIGGYAAIIDAMLPEKLGAILDIIGYDILAKYIDFGDLVDKAGGYGEIMSWYDYERLSEILKAIGTDNIFNFLINNNIMTPDDMRALAGDILDTVRADTDVIKALAKKVYDNIITMFMNEIYQITVNGDTVAKNGRIYLQSAVEALLGAIPDIDTFLAMQSGDAFVSLMLNIDYTDDAYADTTLGFSVELDGDLTELQELAEAYADYFRFDVSDGMAIELTTTVPSVLTQYYSKLLDSEKLTDSLKKKLLELPTMTVSEAADTLEALTDDEIQTIMDAVPVDKLEELRDKAYEKLDSTLGDKAAKLDVAKQKVDAVIDALSDIEKIKELRTKAADRIRALADKAGEKTIADWYESDGLFVFDELSFEADLYDGDVTVGDFSKNIYSLIGKEISFPENILAIFGGKDGMTLSGSVAAYVNVSDVYTFSITTENDDGTAEVQTFFLPVGASLTDVFDLYGIDVADYTVGTGITDEDGVIDETMPAYDYAIVEDTLYLVNFIDENGNIVETVPYSKDSAPADADIPTIDDLPDPKDGYEGIEWWTKDASGNYVEKLNASHFGVEKELNVYIKYVDPITYTVTFYEKDGTQKAQYEYDADDRSGVVTPTLPDLTSDGYENGAWRVIDADGNDIGAWSLSYIANRLENVEVMAFYTPIEYQATFNDTHGTTLGTAWTEWASEILISNFTVESRMITIQVPYDPSEIDMLGYTFKGFSLDTDGDNVGDVELTLARAQVATFSLRRTSTPILLEATIPDNQTFNAEDTSVVAEIAKNNYIVSFYKHGYTSIAGAWSNMTIDSASLEALPDVSLLGMPQNLDFAGWYLDVANDGAINVDSTVDIKIGDENGLFAEYDTVEELIRLLTDSGLSDAEDFDDNHVAYIYVLPYFTLHEFTVSVDTDNDGDADSEYTYTYSEDGQYTFDDAMLNLAAPTYTKTGYTTAAKWYVLDANGDPTDKTWPEYWTELTNAGGFRDIKLGVKLTANVYDIVFKAPDADEWTDETLTYTVEDQTLPSISTEPEKRGYDFAGWYVDANGNGKYDSEDTVKLGNYAYKNNPQDITAVAKFDIKTYTVTFVGKDNETVRTGDTYNVSYTDRIYAPVKPSYDGYNNTNVAWVIYGEDGRQIGLWSLTALSDYRLAENVTVKAEGHEKIQYTVKFVGKDGEDLDAATYPSFNYKVDGEYGDAYVPTTLPSYYGYNSTNAQWKAYGYANNYLGVWNQAFVDAMDANGIFGDITVRATGYTLISNTITFSGGGTVGDIEYNVETATITLPAQEDKIGYTEDGWYVTYSGGTMELSAFMQKLKTDGNYLNIQNGTPQTIEAVAKYSLKTYTANITARAGVTMVISTTDTFGIGTGNYANALTLPTASQLKQTGYTFAGWYYKDAANIEHQLPTTGTETALATVIDAGTGTSINIYAKYTLKTYTVHFMVGNTTYARDTFNLSMDALTPPTDPTKDDNTFSYWKLVNTSLSSYTKAELAAYIDGYDAEEIAVYAVFDPLPVYTVSFEYNGSVIGTDTFTAGATATNELTLPNDPTAAGEIFGGWFITVGGTRYDLSNLTEVQLEALMSGTSITAVADISYRKYIATYTAEDGAQAAFQFTIQGISLPDVQKGYPGDYNDPEWYIDVDGDGEIDADDVRLIKDDADGLYKTADGNLPAGAMSLLIRFVAKQHTVSFIVGGQLLPNGEIDYTADDPITEAPELPEKMGYTAKWQYKVGDDYYDWSVALQNRYHIETVFAVYTANNYTVTFVSPDSADWTQVSKNYTVNSSAMPTLDKAPARTGYKFIGWYVDANANGKYDSADTVKLENYDYRNNPASITAVANFELQTYTATFVADGKTVATVNFTVDQTSINEPRVPFKPGYIGGWGEYTLGAEDIVITAKYVYVASTPEETTEVTETIDETSETDVIDEGEGKSGLGWIWWIIIILIIIIIILVVVLFLIKNFHDDDDDTPPAPEPVVAPEPEPEVIPTVDSVDVETADALMSDAQALAAVELVLAPKVAGPKAIINVSVLSATFAAGDTVDLDTLKAKKLLPKSTTRYKVLADGQLDKPLTVIADQFSVQAIKMITLTGGHAVQKR